MRVITGTARGKKLKTPENMDVRPTTDKVKEAVFNILQFDIEGRRVLDLFAGTGQMGIEALSRGAKSAVFVDASPKSVGIVKENLKSTGLEDNATVITQDALNFLRSGGKFDIIFLDPPYDTELLTKAIDMVFEFDILRENGIMVCESKPEKELPEPFSPYKVHREYKYGKIKITLYTREAD